MTASPGFCSPPDGRARSCGPGHWHVTLSLFVVAAVAYPAMENGANG